MLKHGRPKLPTKVTKRVSISESIVSKGKRYAPVMLIRDDLAIPANKKFLKEHHNYKHFIVKNLGKGEYLIYASKT
jgi:hypothetical protein